MLSYLLSRWRFSRSFERDGEGFIYRESAYSAGVRVTKDEKAQLTRVFKRKYWKYWLYELGAVFALAFIIGAIALATPGSVTDGTMNAIGYIIAAVLLIIVVWLRRRLYKAPAELLTDRTPSTPALTRREVRTATLRKASWVRLSIDGVILAGFAALTFPGAGATYWAPLAWTGFFAFLFGFWIRNLSEKFRLEHPRPD